MAADIKLTDCLIVPHSQPCWDCANACGGCEWSKSFQPVRKMVKNGKREWRPMESYAIRSCPEFVKEERHGETCD